MKTKAQQLEQLRTGDNECKKCGLCKAKAHYVFGTGDPEAKVMFIGEAPGAQEDKKGLPFVGRSGKFLDTLIGTLGITREQTYITNVVKCRPMRDPEHPDMPGNDRPPSKKEMAACLPVLEKQIEIIRPDVICTLGNTPLKALLNVEEGITALHGKKLEYHGVTVIPMFHPAAALRNPNLRDVLKKDFEVIKRELR